ncbi:hypothetical protein [Embleya sp. NBC_00896]|uniref:hypothetical protein n=1 Tax=Embleya sp. NBC_00896 TaxID=2975961 RepID=UPI0038638DE8|nr:hypothetical protein OG928_23765 [Embleya sp. NBC_00896]
MTSPRIVPALVLPVLILAAAGCTTVSAPPPTPRPVAPVGVTLAPPAPTTDPPRPEAEPPAPAITAMAGGPEEPTADAPDAPDAPAAPPTAAPPSAPRTEAPRSRAGAPVVKPAHEPRPARTTAPALRLDRFPRNACDGLAEGGVFPEGGAAHRWCHRQEQRHRHPGERRR